MLWICRTKHVCIYTFIFQTKRNQKIVQDNTDVSTFKRFYPLSLSKKEGNHCIVDLTIFDCDTTIPLSSKRKIEWHAEEAEGVLVIDKNQEPSKFASNFNTSN